MSEKIKIVSMNPRDFSTEEVNEIVESIRAVYSEADFEIIVRDREHTALTWAQVLHISLPFLVIVGWKIREKLADKIEDKVLDCTIEWVRNRFAARKQDRPRPAYITIYGPDGKIVKSVAVKNATDEIDDMTERNKALFERPRPPADPSSKS